jgi:hypothetical protein
MLSFLPRDMLLEIVQYLNPKDFQILYRSVTTTIQHDLNQCCIQCTTVIHDRLVKWFQRKNIQFILLHEIERNNKVIRYLKNGQLHRDNDFPAFISRNGKLQIWFQNGQIHRENNQPAYVYLEENGNVILEWYHHDRIQNILHCSQIIANQFKIKGYIW